MLYNDVLKLYTVRSGMFISEWDRWER